MISYDEYKRDLRAKGYHSLKNRYFENKAGMLFQAIEYERIRFDTIENAFALIRMGENGMIRRNQCFYKCQHLVQRKEEFDDEPMAYCSLADNAFIGSYSDVCDRNCGCVANGLRIDNIL